VKLAWVALSISLLFMPASHARPDRLKDWFGHLAGGYAMVTGDAQELVEDGISIQIGATYWPDEWPVGVQFELGHDDLGLRESAQDERLDNGFDVWRVSVSPIWSMPRKGAVGFHLLGGLGFSRILGRIDTGKLAWNAGIGLDVELSGGSELFLEARYQRIETRVTTEYIPVVVGYRW